MILQCISRSLSLSIHIYIYYIYIYIYREREREREREGSQSGSEESKGARPTAYQYAGPQILTGACMACATQPQNQVHVWLAHPRCNMVHVRLAHRQPLGSYSPPDNVMNQIIRFELSDNVMNHRIPKVNKRS